MRKTVLPVVALFVGGGVFLAVGVPAAAAEARSAEVRAAGAEAADTSQKAARDTGLLETARRMLVENADDEPRPHKMTIQELRGSGEVRETLEIIPAEDEDADAVYLLNGKPVDPETDSLGRFDAVASRFSDDDSEEDDARGNGSDTGENEADSGEDADNDSRDDGTPLFATLRGEPTGRSVMIDGRRTAVWDVEFDTAGGDVYSGTLYIDRETGAPLRLQYDADTPVLVSASTDSYFRPGESGTLQRRSLEINFKIGALFLSRQYRMRIEY